MMTMWRCILLVLCVCDHVYSEKYPPLKNKILSDEKLKGQVLENADVSNKIQRSNREDNPYRLPTTTKPIHYNIWWKINISPPVLTFSGTVDIDLRATQPNVNKIVIHSQNLTIDSLKLQLGEKSIDQTYTFDLDHQFLIITLANGSLEYNAYKPVYYRLSISFNAPIRTDLKGIYRSWYMNFGKINWMATTQFSPAFTRTAVPCYDEPAFKATFDVTITRQENFQSWSNMRRKETRASVYKGYEDDVYHTTPLMCSYLLAMIVTEYDLMAKVEMVNGTEEIYEVMARPDAIETGQGKLMFDLGQIILKELIKYTTLDYYSVQKFMKLTHAAIPDFNAGAMENWGLITYREALLMDNANNSDVDQQQFTIGTVIHETSHSWFGNLVSLEWWDVLWLKEGFAIFFQYFIGDQVTSMGYQTRFIIEHVQDALLADSFDDPQPLTNPDIGSQASLENMFSTITYSKGGSVVRMTDHLLGSENHKYGLRKYLKTRAYQSVRPIDLFESLQEAALETGAIDEYGPDFTIADYYKTWTVQGGHPILNVDVDRQNGVVNIRQRQFNINSGYTTPKMNWVIPITFATASYPDFINTKPTHIIKDENTTLPLALGPNEWIIFNIQQTGFYRINYDEHSWDLIRDILHGPDRELIHEYNRAQIVDDVFQFARSGIMSYNRAFNILSFLKNETAYAPVLAGKYAFNWLINRLTGTAVEKPVKNLFLEWESRVMNELTYLPVEGEPFLRTHLRLLLPLGMCGYGSEECISTARRLIADLYNWGTEVPVSIRTWVYCNGLREGDPNYYNFLFNRYMYHPVNTEQVQIIEFLGCTSAESSLLRLLDAIFKEKFVVREQDLSNAYLAAVQGNEANTQIVFRYIQENLQAVKSRYDSLSDPLTMIAGRLRSESEVKQDWANENKAALGDSYQDIIDAANGALKAQKWAASVQADIKSYLTEGDKPLGPAATKPVA